MLFLYGVLTATGAIVAAEIVFDYSLGDYLKDFFLGAEQKLAAQVARAETRYKYFLAKVRKAL